jgi:hypothetical protein
MKNITRDVIADLWPVYESGESSADTRAIVDEFLSSDPEFAATLRAQPRLNDQVVVPPDAESAALKRTRDLVRGNSWLRALRLSALAFTIFALGRIVSDTTWTASPRRFVGNAVLAVIAWTSYGILLNRYRRRSLQ